MRNLTIFTFIFALMFVCKVGAVGNYATMGWGWVLLPLGLHYVLKFFNYIYDLSKHQLSLTETLKKMQASSVHRKNEKIYKNAVSEFKKELKNGSAEN